MRGQCISSIRRVRLVSNKWCPRPASLEAGYGAEWWGRGRRFGITTLPGDRVYWWAAKNAPANGHAADERAVVAEAFRGWADPVPELIATTPAEKVFRNDIIDHCGERVQKELGQLRPGGGTHEVNLSASDGIDTMVVNCLACQPRCQSDAFV